MDVGPSASESVMDYSDTAGIGVAPNKNFNHIALPSAESPGKERIGDQSGCLINAWPLALQDVIDHIDKHELSFQAVTDKKEFLVHQKGGKNDVYTSVRRLALHRLLDMFVERERHALAGSGDIDAKKVRSEIAFDYGCALYVKRQLGTLEGEFREEELPEELLALVPRTKSVKYKCIWVQRVDLAGEAIAKREAIQALDVATLMNLDRNRHTVFKNKAYYTSSKKEPIPLGDGKVAKEGFEKNIRPIGAFMAIQLDAKTSPFFDSVPLAQFIQQICDLRDVGRNKHLERQLKNLVVKTTHLGKGRERIFEIKGISKQTANSFEFLYKNEEDGSEKQISVAEFFMTRHKMRLRHADLPLVVERRGAKESYHPIEILIVAPNQRVNNAKSTGAMIEQLIKVAQKKPDGLVAQIEDMKYKAYLDDKSNNNLRSWGIQICGNMIDAATDVIYPPDCKYANGNAQRDQRFPEKWRPGNFVAPARLNSIVVMIFDRCMRTDDAREVIRGLARQAQQKGMRIDERSVDYVELDGNYHSIYECLKKRSGKVSIALAFTRDNKDDVHALLKLVEEQTSVLTQHCCSKVLREVASGKPLAAGNILMKMNQKLGGINHTVALSSHAYERSSPMLLSQSKMSWFSKTRMYIGLFVSHAGPQSFADRSLGVEQSEPTVVGMSFTAKETTNQKGWFWMQKPGENLILNMRPRVAEALKMFREVNGDLPTEVVVYRNGKSEGEFRALSTEAEQLISAFSDVASLGRAKEYRPALTIICAMASSNYRIFQKGRGLENVYPGTCLGQDGVHPELKEFVLVAQRAIIGTARPLRFTVVHESAGKQGKLMHIDEIKIVTNALAHASGIVSAPISKPNVLDSAEKLANRGRSNYKAHCNELDDSSTASSGPPGELRNDGSPDFFDNLSKKFDAKLKGTHFWA